LINYITGPRRPFGFALIALFLAATLSGCGYGRLQRLDEAVLRARSEIEVHLRRRAELVPNLLATIENYESIGRELLEAVSSARAGLDDAVRESSLAKMEEWSRRLSESLTALQQTASRNPNLERDPSYRLLRSQLEETQEQVIRAGNAYNEAVARYNEFIAGFPQMVTAKMIGAERLQRFEPPVAGASLQPTDQ
jgi:LemA protein